MEELKTNCPFCYTQIRSTDFFCFNCGKKLREKPLSVSPITQILVYIGSLSLPPMGIIWGIKYLKQQDEKSKIVGIISIILTIASLIAALLITINLINTINTQINSQLQGFGSF